MAENEKEQTSVTAAMAEISDSDLDVPEETEGATESADDGESEDGEGSAEGAASGDAEWGGKGEAEGEDEAEDEAAEGEPGPTDETDLLDTVTPEQLAAIKANPQLRPLYRSLMKAVTHKFQQAGQALKVTEAFRRDPVGVVRALAQSIGATLQEPGARPSDHAPDEASSAAAEIEQLFGAEAGPQVRSVLDRYIDSRAKAIAAPLGAQLGAVTQQAEMHRMTGEEQAFRHRKGSSLTPEIEKTVLELGTSGQFVPGPNQTPAQWLDALFALAQARHANRAASKRLGDRVARNYRDREPSGTSSRSVRPTSRVGQAKSIAEAIDIADEELTEQGR